MVDDSGGVTKTCNDYVYVTSKTERVKNCEINESSTSTSSLSTHLFKSGKRVLNSAADTETTTKKPRISSSNDSGIENISSSLSYQYASSFVDSVIDSATYPPITQAKQQSHELVLNVKLEDMETTYDIIDVNGDGACFPRCIALHMENDENLHPKYRNLAMDYMNDHPEQFQETLQAMCISVAQYTRHHRKARTFVEEFDILATACVLKRRIVVHQYGKVAMVYDPIGCDKSDTYDVIRVAYVDGNHYKLLVEKDPKHPPRISSNLQKSSETETGGCEDNSGRSNPSTRSKEIAFCTTALQTESLDQQNMIVTKGGENEVDTTRENVSSAVKGIEFCTIDNENENDNNSKKSVEYETRSNTSRKEETLQCKPTRKTNATLKPSPKTPCKKPNRSKVANFFKYEIDNAQKRVNKIKTDLAAHNDPSIKYKPWRSIEVLKAQHEKDKTIITDLIKERERYNILKNIYCKSKGDLKPKIKAGLTMDEVIRRFFDNISKSNREIWNKAVDHARIDKNHENFYKNLIKDKHEWTKYFNLHHGFFIPWETWISELCESQVKGGHIVEASQNESVEQVTGIEIGRNKDDHIHVDGSNGIKAVDYYTVNNGNENVNISNTTNTTSSYESRRATKESSKQNSTTSKNSSVIVDTRKSKISHNFSSNYTRIITSDPITLQPDEEVHTFEQNLAAQSFIIEDVKRRLPAVQYAPDDIASKGTEFLHGTDSSKIKKSCCGDKNDSGDKDDSGDDVESGDEGESSDGGDSENGTDYDTNDSKEDDYVEIVENEKKSADSTSSVEDVMKLKGPNLLQITTGPISKTSISKGDSGNLSTNASYHQNGKEPNKKASSNFLTLCSPTQSEVTPSAHTDMDKMLQLIQISDHYVYGLFLLKEDGSIDHCFYIGESYSPQDRLIQHRGDTTTNEAKWRYFKDYPRSRIRMIILHRGNMGQCLALEKLLIVYANDFPNFNLTNKTDKYYYVELDCDVVSALQQLIDRAILSNEGFNTHTVKASERQQQRVLRHNQRRSREIRSERNERALDELGIIRPLLPINQSMSNNSAVNNPTKLNINPSNPDTDGVNSNFAKPENSCTDELKWQPSGNPSKDAVKFNFNPSNLDVDILNSNLAKLGKPYVDRFKGGLTKLVNEETILDLDTIMGTFKTMTQEEFGKLVHDETSATVFAARCRLVRYEAECPRCGRKMKVKPKTNQYAWVCRFTENKIDQFCYSKPLFQGSILKQNFLSCFVMIRVIYFVSKGLSNDEIVAKIGKVTFHIHFLDVLNTIRSNVLDHHLKVNSTNLASSTEYRRVVFTSDQTIDHFGLLLSWLVPKRQILKSTSSSDGTTSADSSKDAVKFNFNPSNLDVDILYSNLEKLGKPYVDKFKGGLSKLVIEQTILDLDTIVGTFTTMSEETLKEFVHDETSAVAFAARCRLIMNEANCVQCGRIMKVRLNSNGHYEWICRFNQNITNRICSSQQLFKGSILTQNFLSCFILIRVIYSISKGLSNVDIVSKIEKVKYRNHFCDVLNTIRRNVLDQHLKVNSSNLASSIQSRRVLFISDQTLDHFGLLLSWLVLNQQHRVIL